MDSARTRNTCSSQTCSRTLGGLVLRCSCFSNTTLHWRFSAMSATTWISSLLLGPVGISSSTLVLVSQLLALTVVPSEILTRSWLAQPTKVSFPRLRRCRRVCSTASGWYRCRSSTHALSLLSIWLTQWQLARKRSQVLSICLAKSLLVLPVLLARRAWLATASTPLRKLLASLV